MITFPFSILTQNEDSCKGDSGKQTMNIIINVKIVKIGILCLFGSPHCRRSTYFQEELLPLGANWNCQFWRRLCRGE